VLYHAVLTTSSTKRDPCTDGDHLRTYIVCLLVLNALLMVLALGTAFASSRGTILDARPRRHVATLLYVRLPLLVVELALNFYGTVAIARGLL